MGKIDIEFRSKRSQRTVSCIDQGVCGAIIRRSEPFALEDSPERLGDIQMWTTVEEKEIQPTFLPIGRSSRMSSALWTLALSRTTKCFNGYGEKIGQKSQPCQRSYPQLWNPSYRLLRSIMPNIESQTSYRWDIDIFTRNCHPYGTFPRCRCAFISIINVDETIFFLFTSSCSFSVLYA